MLEVQAKELQTKVDEAEQNALKNGKKAMTKMESRIRELEAETDAESRRLGESTKNLRRSERKIKELTFQSDEDRKNNEKVSVSLDTVLLRMMSLLLWNAPGQEARLVSSLVKITTKLKSVSTVNWSRYSTNGPQKSSHISDLNHHFSVVVSLHKAYFLSADLDRTTAGEDSWLQEAD